MSEIELPLLVRPETLRDQLGSEGVLLVDLSQISVHRQVHIPGAVHMEYSQIVAARPPTGGLLPDEGQLGAALSRIGFTPGLHVVAYDDEGGGKAARLLWTLEALGHSRFSLLDGGLHAWAGEQYPLTAEPTPLQASDYRARFSPVETVVATTEFILEHLEAPEVALLDARSPAEFDGSRKYAARGGHIPGAHHMEWTEVMDQQRNLRLKPAEWGRGRLGALGIRPEQTVVAYCQTHHRSALSWFWLKWLGYRALGYPGSWSEWGNRADLPVER